MDRVRRLAPDHSGTIALVRAGERPVASSQCEVQRWSGRRGAVGTHTLGHPATEQVIADAGYAIDEHAGGLVIVEDRRRVPAIVDGPRVALGTEKSWVLECLALRDPSGAAQGAPRRPIPRAKAVPIPARGGAPSTAQNIPRDVGGRSQDPNATGGLTPAWNPSCEIAKARAAVGGTEVEQGGRVIAHGDERDGEEAARVRRPGDDRSTRENRLGLGLESGRGVEALKERKDAQTIGRTGQAFDERAAPAGVVWHEPRIGLWCAG